MSQTHIMTYYDARFAVFKVNYLYFMQQWFKNTNEL